PAANPVPGRGHQPSRCRLREAGQRRRARAAHHQGDHRPPPGNDRQRRPRPADGRRPDRARDQAAGGGPAQRRGRRRAATGASLIMGEPLFRPEVVEARRKGWLGGISLAQPLRLWVLAVSVTTAAVAIGIFLAMGEYTRRSRVQGQLVPDLGVATVVAPGPGIVDRILPREGERVLAGAPLALVAAPRTTQGGSDTRESIAEGIERRRASVLAAAGSHGELLDAREASLRKQHAALGRELDRLRGQLAIRKRQEALARETLQRYRALRREQYLSELQVNRQEQAVLDLVSGRQALERQQAALQRDLAQVDEALRGVPAER